MLGLLIGRELLNLTKHPLSSPDFRVRCKGILDAHGVLVLPEFLRHDIIKAIRQEGLDQQQLAYYTAGNHNIYLEPADPTFGDDHPRNREVSSSKGCITTDQIPQQSYLHQLYDNYTFRDFLCDVLGEQQLYEYSDPLSSVNLHYASEGQELGWHYDNSSFAITLMIQAPKAGGVFEYVKDVRDADNNEMNYTFSGEVLDGTTACETLTMDAGTRHISVISRPRFNAPRHPDYWRPNTFISSVGIQH